MSVGRLLVAPFLAAVEAVRQRPELSSEIWLCRFSQLELTPLDQIDPETVVVTASMVGAPAAQEKFVAPADMIRRVELFTQSTGVRPGGIVTNENGGGSTFNGWLEASMLGIPLIDAPCNGPCSSYGSDGKPESSS